MIRKAVILSLSCSLTALHAYAAPRGVSPYLPINLEPEIERQIERVLILADKPVLTRPIAAATVLDALPKACEIDPLLCQQVRRYLGRFMYRLGVSQLSIEGAATGGEETVVPNQHGLNSDSSWRASAQAYLQPGDYVLLNAGAVAYQGEIVPTGSMVSLGFSFAQLDIGYRDHWLSPMTDSSMLLSTEAQTMPSVTLSNYIPLTRLGLRYEAFLAEMSESDRIRFQNRFTSGNPRLAGLHLSMEPVSGWALGFNRIMQFGGGERGGNSLGDIFDAFFQPSKFDNVDDPTTQEQFGNQAASFTSRFLFPGRTPFAVYFEYAGEDTSRGRNYLLGNSALSAGIHFPRIFRQFEFTYETSEWQNGWYVHGIYLDGLVNEGRIIGHWGADQRQPGDDVGAQTHMLRLGWYSQSGSQVELQYRTLDNESYSSVDYERAYNVTLRYSRPWNQFTIGAEVFTGRDVFGEDFSRIAAFLRYSENPAGRGVLFDSSYSSVEQDKAEIFVDAGVNANRVRVDLDNTLPRTTTDTSFAPHIAIGARRAVSDRQDLGVRLELDDIDGNTLLAVRAVDYRYRFRNPLALSFFLGAARYDLATPAYGLYGGIGAQWRDLLPGWDVGLDLRSALKVARDDVLPTDLVGNRPDSFYDIQSASFYITRRF